MCDAAESLHQCLHQIIKSGERDAVKLLADSLGKLLSADAVRRLVAALADRAGAAENP